MPLLETPSGQLFYEVKGEGEPLVMLRGMSFSVRHWLGFDDLMARHFRVMTLDHRGIGRSNAKASWNLTIEDMADDVKRLLDHCKIEKAAVLGFSLGGMIALALGARHPQNVRALITVNTSIAGLGLPRLTPAAVWAMVRHARHDEGMLAALGGLLYEKGTQSLDRQAIAKQWLTIFKEEGFPRETSMKQTLAALRFRARRSLQKLSVPTLLVYGDEDRFVPPINTLLLHRIIPQAEIAKISGAGHELMLDAPDELQDAISRFLARH